MIEYRMNIAVCDDDPHDLNSIAQLIEKIAREENIECTLARFDDGTALLEAIEAGASFHALWLDVMMPKMGGIELAAALRARQDNTSIVFVSLNWEMALRGYEVAASRYLIKPLEEEKLREALLFCYRAGLAKHELMLPTARGMRRLSIHEIVYIETWGRGVRVALKEGQEEVCMKISELTALLPSQQFVLCHRTLLVNLDYVRYLRYCELELKNGGTLPVSKYRQNAIRERLMNYLEG